LNDPSPNQGLCPGLGAKMGLKNHQQSMSESYSHHGDIWLISAPSAALLDSLPVDSKNEGEILGVEGCTYCPASPCIPFQTHLAHLEPNLAKLYPLTKPHLAQAATCKQTCADGL